MHSARSAAGAAAVGTVTGEPTCPLAVEGADTRSRRAGCRRDRRANRARGRRRRTGRCRPARRRRGSSPDLAGWSTSTTRPASPDDQAQARFALQPLVLARDGGYDAVGSRLCAGRGPGVGQARAARDALSAADTIAEDGVAPCPTRITIGRESAAIARARSAAAGPARAATSRGSSRRS